MTPTPRELADLCERAPGFDAETLQLLANTLRAQAGEIDQLRADVEQWQSLSDVRGIQVQTLVAEVAHLKSEATALANQSFLTIKSWKDMVDGLVAENDGLKAEGSALFDNWEETRMKLALRNDEIDALKAEAIVRGSQRLDEAVKTALEREKRTTEIDELKVEIQHLKAEMSIHDTPGGGVAGMLTITPEAAEGLMEGDE